MTHTATSYLKTLVPHWKQVVKNYAGSSAGCPVILIVCCSGLRAVQFIRFAYFLCALYIRVLY